MPRDGGTRGSGEGDETGEVVVEKLVQVYDVGRAINPTLVEGQIEGGAMMGLGLGLLESSYPYYPSLEHRGEKFGAYLAPSLEDLPELDNVIVENPSAQPPVRTSASTAPGTRHQSMPAWL